MSSERYRQLFFLGFAIIFLCATNRWLSWNEGIKLLSANDVLAYQTIAAAAPRLPSQLLQFHHAQRLIAPYLIGLLHQGLAVPLPQLFQLAMLMLIGGIIFWIDRLWQRLPLDGWSYDLAMLVLFTNPYIFRYNMIVPGMLPDAVFVAGLAILLVGLVEGQFFIVGLGVLLGATGRQTMLLVLPGLLLWLFWGSSFKLRSQTQKVISSLAIVGLVIVLYIGTGWLALAFVLPSPPLPIFTGLLSWIGSDRFQWFLLLEHLVRLTLPLLTPVVITIAWAIASWQAPYVWQDPERSFSQDYTLEQVACGLMTAGIVAQPLLSGPEITGQTATRLAVLGLLPLLLVLGLALHSQPTIPHNHYWRLKVGLGVVLAIGSLHHLYSVVGPPSAGWLLASQVVVAALAGGMTYRLRVLLA